MTREQAKREIDSLDYYLQNHTDDYSEESHTAMMMAISALSAEPCRTADDYENEIADLHNRLNIAEYDKERYKEEITILEAENKEELTNEKAIAFLQDNGWLVEHDRIMTSGIENKGEWIPVIERLPEDYDRVLITVNGCRGLIVREAQYYKAQNEFKVLHNNERWKVEEKGLLAWKPLPEPYQKGGEE